MNLNLSRLSPLPSRYRQAALCRSALLAVLATAFLSVWPVNPAHAGEREEIVAVLRELEYLRERVLALSRKHGSSKAKIRFNYLALLEQLRATENGIRAYLNAEINVIHTRPPQPVDQELFRVRKN